MTTLFWLRGIHGVAYCVQVAELSNIYPFQLRRRWPGAYIVLGGIPTNMLPTRDLSSIQS